MPYFFIFQMRIHRASSVVLLTRLDFTLQEVLRSFDVVGLLERFDETLLMVADAVGLQRLLYTRLIPRTTNPRIRKPNFTSVCPDEARCRAHIATVGWADHVIYDEAKTAFERRLSQLGAPFAARVAEFKRARAAWAGRAMDTGDKKALAVISKRSNPIITMSQEATNAIKAIAEPQIAEWVKSMDAAGLPGQAMLDDARALIAKYND